MAEKAGRCDACDSSEASIMEERAAGHLRCSCQEGTGGPGHPMEIKMTLSTLYLCLRAHFYVPGLQSINWKVKHRSSLSVPTPLTQLHHLREVEVLIIFEFLGYLYILDMGICYQVHVFANIFF